MVYDPFVEQEYNMLRKPRFCLVKHGGALAPNIPIYLITNVYMRLTLRSPHSVAVASVSSWTPI